MQEQTKKPMGFVGRLLAGALMGVGCVLPGVSGGVMAVSFGLYRPMLDAVLGFFRDIKKNVAFLLPLALGGGAGLLLGAKVLLIFMQQYQHSMLFLFMGFIIGGIPDLVKDANQGGFRPRYLWALALGVALAAGFAFGTGSEAVIATADVASLSPVQALLAGGIFAVGTIVPGISTSFLLLYLGWYNPILQAVSSMEIVTLLCVAGGAAVCAILVMKLAKFLFDRVPNYAYYGVMGFLLVSIGLVFPGFAGGTQLIIDLLLFVAGALCALKMGNLRPAETA